MAKKLGRHRKVVSRIRAKRSKEKETVSRVYSQRWETKLAPHAVAYKPYTTQQLPSGESTAIKNAEYDPKTKIMNMTFWGYKQQSEGGEYNYFNIPQRVWEAFNEASSKGRYFYYFIRDRYNYQRVG